METLAIRKKHYLFILFALMTLACKSTQDMTLNLERSNSQEGFLVVETFVNSKRIAGPLTKWTEIHLRKLSKDQTASFKIIASESELGRSLFVGNLSPGQYYISYLKSTAIIDKKIEGSLRIPEVFGTFEIKKGFVTNLGTIIFHPIKFQSIFTNELPDHIFTRIENQHLTNKLKENVSGSININEDVLSWQENEVSEFYFPKALDKVLNEPAMSARAFRVKGQRGNLILAKLGSFFYKSDNKEVWEKYRLNSFSTLLSFVELDNKKWLFGGENGMLQVFDLETNEFKKVIPPDYKSSIYDLGYLKIGRYYLITFKDDEYKLYFFDPQSFEYALKKTFKKKKHKEGIIDSSRPIIVDVSTNNFDVFINSKRYRFDVADNWSEEKSRELLYSFKQPNGITIANPVMRLFSGNESMYSLNDGISWQKTKRTIFSNDYLVSSLYFQSDSILIQVKEPTAAFFVRRPIKSITKVLISNDLGESWKEISSIPLGCNCVLNTISTDKSIYVLCESGDIIVSENGGLTWEKDFVHQLNANHKELLMD